MARYTQRWKCTACGHSALKLMSYPKLGGPTTPLTEVAHRARCSHCGERGHCTITEEKAAPVLRSSGSVTR